ncbi:MAG: response regulator transcription factor [Bifidobacterium subtile]|jgi:DNA-binding NarL/FixJ family response regulator|nr:response regulator transcription factor [Bifidobacterium subtile]MCI1242142.1 response regulator transcription factor [Bifidobacterium subtile]
MMNSEILHIGIVDNDPLIPEALADILARSGAPVQVVWTATTGERALSMCESAKQLPEVVLTDLAMPQMSGLQLAALVQKRFPGITVVGMSAFDTSSLGGSEADAGFRGDDMPAVVPVVVPKDAPTVELVHALGRAAGIRSAMEWDGGESARSPLSDMEIRVIRLYAKGRTTDAIAHQLEISPESVKTYMKRVYAKFGVHSRAEAVSMCVREGIVR